MTDAQEFFEERAGILEHDAQINRTKAESIALRMTVLQFGQEAIKPVYEAMLERRKKEGRG